ncbi:MAG: hypothetical protein ACR2NA_02415 [Solirubrobacterales bacterium]
MSEWERPDRLAQGYEPTADDIRELVGPVTPHFALQVRERVRRIIAPLPEGHPARVEGEQQLARLAELSDNSGEPRGDGPLSGAGIDTGEH